MVACSQLRADAVNLLEFLNTYPTEKAVIDAWITHTYPGGVSCSRCGSKHVYQRADRFKSFNCRHCGTTFSVTAGTMFHRTRIDLRYWFYAIYKIAYAARKGISANQIHRECKISYPSAWGMLKKIREAMAREELPEFGPVTEADETFVGGKPRRLNSKWVYSTRQETKKIPVLTLYDRQSGLASARVATISREGKRLSAKQLAVNILEKVRRDSIVLSDENPGYQILSRLGYTHLSVPHNRRYVAEDRFTHVNGCESFHAPIKRSFMGVYHSMSAKYLPLYMAEAQFRWNTRTLEPADRLAKILVLGGEGRRSPEPEWVQRREAVEREQAEQRVELERKRRVRGDGQMELF